MASIEKSVDISKDSKPRDSDQDAGLMLAVRRLQLEQIYTQYTNGFIGQLLSGLIGVILLHEVTASWKLILWFGIFALIQVIRFGYSRQYPRTARPLSQKAVSHWSKVHTIISGTTAAAWSTGAYFLWAPDSGFHQVAFALVILATTAAAFVGYTIHRPSYSIYTTLAIIPLSLRFIIEGTERHSVLGLALLVYLAMMMRVAARSHQGGIQALIVGVKYQQLADVLSEEKKRAEILNQQLSEQTEALQKSEARFRALSSSTFEGIAIHENGMILDANLAAMNMFGYSEDEIHYLPITDLILPQYHQLAIKNVQTGYEEPYEAEGIRKDGSVFPIEIQGKTIFYEENVVRVVAARNIMIRKEAEQRAIELQLEQERVKLMTTFLQNASHEFRTPLSIIKTASHLISRSDESHKHHKRITQIEHQVGRINTLVDDLLLMVQLSTGFEVKWQSVVLNDVLKTAIGTLQEMFDDKQHNLNFEPNEQLPLIQSDTELLYRAVYAILQNAARYTPEGGSISIQTTTNNNHVYIEIRDDGVGIDAELLTHIFDRFYRLDEAHSTAGLGIGLSIAKQIVELHHGEISAQSQINEGSTFTIQLPIERD